MALRTFIRIRYEKDGIELGEVSVVEFCHILCIIEIDAMVWSTPCHLCHGCRDRIMSETSSVRVDEDVCDVSCDGEWDEAGDDDDGE